VPARAATGELPAGLCVDWPRRLPVTQAEIDVLEAWLSDFFDEFLNGEPTCNDLINLIS